jgi:IS30 family transposase
MQKHSAKELFFPPAPHKNHINSITSDNGSEFCEHKYIAKMLNATFFCSSPVFPEKAD